MRIVIAGGGTAGHVFPALALARRLASAGHEVRFVGTAHGQEARLVPAAGFPLVEVEARPLVRRPSLRAVVAPIAALRSVGRLRPVVRTSDVVVGMGGYVSVPAALAALRERRPLVLHEQNAVPGLANRILARGARSIGVAFADAARALPRRASVIVTGNPVRDEILAVGAERERLAKEAIEELELDEARATVVVFGGSQGALHLNRSTVEAVRGMTSAEIQVVLLTGAAHAGSVRAALGPEPPVPVRVLAFLERMELAYAAADLVVARAGATTVAEVAACGVASVLIPYPYATGRHQEANARALQRAGGASVLLDDELDGPALAERIRELLDDPDRLRSMGERARAWSRPDAADALAALVLDAGAAA
ncbi:MAG TPA: undecaprenyldiphospho-muramoylpentapeptide beta-N-acetylglucosaminyltransferase [Actinomycetota bacterium]